MLCESGHEVRAAEGLSTSKKPRPRSARVVQMAVAMPEGVSTEAASWWRVRRPLRPVRLPL
jgi:hypothetical protein